MDFNGIRRLYLPLRPKARFAPGRKTPPSVPAPSAGLRPLSVSRVKCGGGPCRDHSVLPCVGNTICLQYALYKIVEDLISACRKQWSRQGPPHLRLEAISARIGLCPVPRKPPPESSVPGKNLNGESRRNQFWRGYGSPSVLNEVSHEFSTAMRFEKCKRSP